MAKQLDPQNDLLFAGSHGGNGTSKVVSILSPGGHPIADDDAKNPIHDTHQHLAGMSTCVTEKLDVMGLAIVNLDWIQFDTIAYKLSQLKPSSGQMNGFFREQIADAVIRSVSLNELDEVRRKLKQLGARDKALDEGYETGLSRLKQLQSKKRH